MDDKLKLENELDELLTDYLELLDSFQSNQLNLSNSLKSGYFELARTKLALGPNRIGASNFDLGESLSRVAITISPSKLSNKRDGDVDSTKTSSFSFSLGLSSSSLESLSASAVESTPIPTEPSSKLRNRLNPSTTSSTSTSTPSTSKIQVEKEEGKDNIQPRQKSRNPIYQFSAFPPPSLRDSQLRFEKVLEFGVERVRLDCELRDLEGKIEEIRRRLI